MRLYRVLPYLANAADDEPGGVFFRPASGKNRADSPTPGYYRCLYVGDSPSGAIAEAFGRFDDWDNTLFKASPATPALPNSHFALATCDLSDTARICDLDDPTELLARALRPSNVVTRDRAVTQAWAKRIFNERSYVGVNWWSYYDPNWRSLALWDIADLALAQSPRLLRANDPDVIDAARAIARRLRL